MPEFLAAARPEDGFAGFKGHGEGFFVHVGHHQHLAGVVILNNGGDKAFFIVLGLNVTVDHGILYNLSFFDEVSMDGTYIIRAAKPDDIVAIDHLCHQLGYEVDRDGLQRRFHRIMHDPNQLMRVAVKANNVAVGWVHALPVCYLESEPFIEIGGLVVDFSCRRMGIGQALMTAAEDWSRDRGITTIRLRSNSKRTAAHEFYRSIGYEVVKQQFTFVKELR